jgi:hypothetical protein
MVSRPSLGFAPPPAGRTAPIVGNYGSTRIPVARPGERVFALLKLRRVHERASEPSLTKRDQRHVH